MSTASIPQVTHSPVAPAFTDVKQFILRELNVNAGTYALKVHGRSATNLSAEQAAHEALKFYSHYAAIGWMLGGINPIINWKAAARKWLLNCWQHVPRVASSTGRKTLIPANHVLNNDGKDFTQAL